MAVISNSVVIRCTKEEAFDYLCDNRNELEWNPICEMMEKITDGPVGPGTKFRAKWKMGPVAELEIEEYDRPNGWTTHSGGALEVIFKARLETVSEGTRLHVDFNAQPHGFLRLIFPFILRKIRSQEKDNMRYLRDALERRSAAAATVSS